MTPSQTLIAACLACFIGWSAYEAFRMRRSRLKTDLQLTIVTAILQMMEKRQDVALQNDAAIAETLQRISRPANPADGGQP
jgi:hypothetical protein